MSIKQLIIGFVLPKLCFGALYEVEGEILNRLKNLEDSVNEHELRASLIKDLTEKIERKDDEIMDLKAICKTLRSEINTLDVKLASFEDEFTTAQFTKKNSDHSGDAKRITTMMKITNKTSESPGRVHMIQGNIEASSFRRKARGSGNTVTTRNAAPKIAFTAILEDTDVYQIPHAGLNQVIKYNKIITNVGNSYSIHSGVFKAPVDGVYIFHFTATTGWTHERLWVRLMVDSVAQNGGVAGSFNDYQDIQAGNVAVLRLRQGQVVWVETFHYNDVHIYAWSGFSSFSGVLLFEY